MSRTAQLIVVVDDDRGINEMICAALTDEGYRTIGCFSGADGFAVIEREYPDLVVVDLWMEALRAGMLLLKQMRQTPSLQHIPVIMAAANNVYLKAHWEELLALQCVPLAKPFDLGDFLELVQQLLNSRDSVTQA